MLTGVFMGKGAPHQLTVKWERERGGERGRERKAKMQKKCKQMGQSLYYSCDFSIKWKLYQNKKILPKTKQANKPAAVVSSQATNTRLTTARRPVLPVGAGASPECGRSRPCRRRRAVTLRGRLRWLQQVL